MYKSDLDFKPHWSPMPNACVNVCRVGGLGFCVVGKSLSQKYISMRMPTSYVTVNWKYINKNYMYEIPGGDTIWWIAELVDQLHLPGPFGHLICPLLTRLSRDLSEHSKTLSIFTLLIFIKNCQPQKRFILSTKFGTCCLNYIGPEVCWF